MDVLDQLETWVHKIYAKAGIIEDSQSYDANSSTAPGIGDLPATSRPDQPLSHAHPPPHPSDPLAKVRVRVMVTSLQEFVWLELRTCEQDAIQQGIDLTIFTQ